MNVDIAHDGGIMLSEDYLALLLKSLLRSVFGKAFLTIEIKSSADKLFISARTNKAIHIPEFEINKLIRIARNAGMEVEENPESFSANMNFVSEKEYSVYAVNFSRDKKIITSKLFEIFDGK